MLSVNSSFKEIFNNIQPMIAFRKKTSLKQLVEKKQNKKQPRIFHTYTNHTNHNSRPIYTILHHSITLLPTISQNSNIYKLVNERDLYNLSSSHLPRNYVIYLLECVMCNIQYAGRSERLFNIRLNNHRKDMWQQTPQKCVNILVTMNIYLVNMANLR